MLGYPLMYLMDIEDYQPSLLATWTFSQAPSRWMPPWRWAPVAPPRRPTRSAPTFRPGTSTCLSGFMAIDASSLYNEYMSGEDSYS